MPYNKGDITQQGIAGDVTSLVRLNEKRTVKLTLSADDASDNCDISGSVIDELNGKTYPIGAGVSGNIEITENGENINVAPYATATVNVSGGGSDFLKTSFTIVNTTENSMTYDNFMAGIYRLENQGCIEIPSSNGTTGVVDGSVHSITIPANDSVTFNFYYAFTEGSLSPESCGIIFTSAADLADISDVVNMTLDIDNNAYMVTDLTADSALTYTKPK